MRCGVERPTFDSKRPTRIAFVKEAATLLAALCDFLAEDLPATGREGEALVFGRTASQAFVASTIDTHAKRAWDALIASECEAAEDEGREPELLAAITLQECRHTFASLLIDAEATPKAIKTFMGHSKRQTTSRLARRH